MRDSRHTLERSRATGSICWSTRTWCAVNSGKLFAYADQGVRQVGIDPEWLPPKRAIRVSSAPRARRQGQEEIGGADRGAADPAIGAEQEEEEVLVNVLTAATTRCARTARTSRLAGLTRSRRPRI
jgi:hypothetical protein